MLEVSLKILSPYSQSLLEPVFLFCTTILIWLPEFITCLGDNWIDWSSKLSTLA